MTGHRPGRSQASHRSQTQGHSRHGGQVGHHVLPARVHRHVGPGAAAVSPVAIRDFLGRVRIHGPHRPSASCAVDETHDGEPQFASHLLGGHLLADDRRIGRPSAHCEVVGGHHHRAAIQAGPTEQEVGCPQVDKGTLVVVGGAAGNLADLVERPLVDQGIDALAHVHLAPFMLSGDLLLAAHPLSQRLPLAQFG